MLASIPAVSSAVAPPTLWQKCSDGSPSGSCPGSGIAVDPDSGHIYVADPAADRINELDAWGTFLRGWGWGVVASGPNDDPQNETQEVVIDATAGSFRLRFGRDLTEQNTAPIPFDASAATVQAALEGISNGAAHSNLDPGDVAATGPVGGPWAIEFTGSQADADIPPLQVVESTLSGPGGFSVTTTQEGANFEVCVPADGDVCGEGQGRLLGSGIPSAGGKPGQLGNPQGVALDSTGDLYVVDRSNRRVQKFDLSGPLPQFEWVVGSGVNAGPSNPGNLCTAADIVADDTCRAGNVGSAPGEFPLAWDSGAFIAVGQGDQVYVGDENRIQVFGTDGAYQSEIPFAGETVSSLTADPSGDLYVAFRGSVVPKANVSKLSPAGAPICTLDVERPTAIAVGPAGQVHVVSANSGGTGATPMQILRFDAATCLEVDRYDAEEEGYTRSTAIAVSSSCGIPGFHLYVANKPEGSGGETFLRASGPPPDPGLCPPPPVPPGISETLALSVGTETATVRAQINPRFWDDATYQVQYGTADCSLGGCATTPVPAAALTEQVVDADFPAQAELTGLEPDTTYHYRFLAQSSGGGPAFGSDRTFTTFAEPAPIETNCPNQAFRTGASADLPDCRAYEMVSPLDKNGGDIWQAQSSDLSFPDKLDQAAPGGSALTYSTYRAFGDAQSADYAPQYIASRDPGAGWSSHGIGPPRSGPSFYNNTAQVIHIQAVSEDLCSAFFLQDTDNSIAPGDQPGYVDLYRRQNCNDPEGFEALTTEPPKNIPPGGFGQLYFPRVQGFSADGSLAFLRANAKLTSNATSADVFQLYVNSGGTLRLISVLPSGAVATTNSSLGVQMDADRWHRRDNLANAVSGDGSRVFWTTTNTASTGTGEGRGRGPGHLYVRLNPDRGQSPISGGECIDSTRACTIEVSEAVSTDPARYWGATPDGSAVLFSFDSGPEDGNLYSFDVDTETPTLVAKDLLGVMGASEDLSRVYFASAAEIGGEGTANKPNLYLYDEGDTEFVATLEEMNGNQSGSNAPSPFGKSPAFRSARVSPDGSVAAFTSIAPLTGIDNTDAESGKPASEVFRYDTEANAGAGELRCVSCNRTGAQPRSEVIGPCASGVCFLTSAHLPGWEYSLHASRVLSGDGRRLFFNSFDKLDPRDTNGRQDVYQWEAPGKGNCDAGDVSFAPDAAGCVSLISSGDSPKGSEFIDASADGSDVFIRTSSNLISPDTEAIDIYDARIGGGLASQHPAAPAPPCEGEGCRGAATAAPGVTGAGSAAFQGPGNPVANPPKACPRGKRKVLRKGKARCVSRKRASRQRRESRAAGNDRKAGR